MVQRAKLNLNTKQIKAKQRAGALKGLKVALEHLLQSSRELVPLEEGTLARSGTTTVDAANLRGAVSYDGPYAVRQHEELTWRHDPGKQAKYLEQPLNDEAGTMQELIAAQIRRSLQ
jgi:hypothetical protein